MTEIKKGSVFTGFLWMLVLSIVLFWLPIIGSFFAGLVGGKKSGGIGNAFLASVLPSLILGGFVFFMFAVVGMPFIGAFLGWGAIIISLLCSVFLITGALIGGLLA